MRFKYEYKAQCFALRCLSGYFGMLDQTILCGLEHPVVWELMEIAINNQQVNMVSV